MKYVLFVREGGSPVEETDVESTVEPDQSLREEYVALKADLIERGLWLGGQALHDQSTTTRVEVRRGDRLVVDGPLVESAEQIIGYYLLDCSDLDEALAVAARIPGARSGHVEVRPVWDYEAEFETGDRGPTPPGG